MVDSHSSSLTWRLFKNDEWLLFSNNVQLKTKKPAEKDQKAGAAPKKNKTAFYFSSRKPETKGSMIYTPDGYGIIQDIDPSMKKIPVKINNKINEYSVDDLISDIPLTLRYVSNGMNHEDKITVPVFSTSRDLVEKIEGSFEGESCFSTKIFFNGREMVRSADPLEKIGVFPDSKLIVVSSLGKPFFVNRFTTVYQGWGYSNSCDGIAFSASKDIRVMGFGIYTPEKDKQQLCGMAKFIQGNDAKNMPIFSKEVTVMKDETDPEEKIYRFYFDRPYKIKAGDSYSCVVEMRSGNSYYGSSGQYTANGEQDVVFSFTDCTGSMNGTSPSSGQIPEIYYFV